MPILDNEILWRPAALQSDTLPAQNGGRMTFSQLVSGVKNNLFPDVSQAERLAGAVKWRKAFIHINSAQDTALLNVRLFIDALTPAGDFVTFTPGTPTDTEQNIAGRPYGIGLLQQASSSGATQLLITAEHAEYATLTPFRTGDLIRVSDRPSTGGSGNEEWVLITAVSYDGANVSLELAAPLSNAYAPATTLVSSVWQSAAIAGGFTNPVLTSSTGQLDSGTQGNLIAHNKGAIAEHWTLTFLDATSFTISGVSLGSLPAPGSITADSSPINPATNSPYFTIKAGSWSGVFQAGDQLSFETTPAAIPVWYRRQVPAGTFSLANDLASLALHGESA